MNGSDPREKLPEIAPAPPVIAYATAVPFPQAIPTKPRRWWAFVIVGIYLLFVAVLLTVPIWMALIITPAAFIPTSVVVTILTLCGLGMLVAPVRAARRWPMTRRSILIPIIASGLLLGGLVWGGSVALVELFSGTCHPDNDFAFWGVLDGAVVVWIGWSIVFILIMRDGDPTSLGMKLHRILIGGSFLELVVAVPSHLIVRQRSECCAGVLTGMGICIGVVIAIVSFGPAVFLLYFQRCKRIANG